jgi:hypothetical protein
MAILLAQYWDIVEGKESEYEQFILKTYIPSMELQGLRIVGAFYVVVGAGPRIVGCSTTENLAQLSMLVTSEAYTTLHEQLFPLIRNFSSKLLVSYGPIEVRRYEVQLNIWKFNQYFNIVPGMEKAYRAFLQDEFIPKMEQLGITITNIWKVAVGSGPFILVEGSSPGITDIASSIDTDEYRSLMRTLKSKYIMDYQSKILAPTRRVELPYFIRGLTAGL